jgi:hypothetical protein
VSSNVILLQQIPNDASLSVFADPSGKLSMPAQSHDIQSHIGSTPGTVYSIFPIQDLYWSLGGLSPDGPNAIGVKH